jgi:hypothetical protein
MNNFPNSKDSVPSTSSNNAIQTFTSVLTSGPSTIDLDNEKFTQSKLISIKTPMDFYFIKMIGEGAFSTVTIC